MKSRLDIVAAIGIAVLLLGCRSEQHEPLIAYQLSEKALQGKAIFEEKNCGRCHALEAGGATQTRAPDLTDPFLANDSLFVQAHLKFVEESTMPAIALSEKEIRLVSYFIAELHAATHRSASPALADTVCAVCYAPVAMEQAERDGLAFTYLQHRYYFECDRCKALFIEAPEAYRRLLLEHTATVRRTSIK